MDDQISVTAAKLMSHEQVCAERYLSIEKRMTKMEYLLYGVMLCVLLGPGQAAEFFKRLFL